MSTYNETERKGVDSGRSGTSSDARDHVEYKWFLAFAALALLLLASCASVSEKTGTTVEQRLAWYEEVAVFMGFIDGETAEAVPLPPAPDGE